MKVLVTGASGYVGSRLVPRLLSDGHDVRASFSSAGRADDLWWHDHERLEVAEMDVLDADAVRSAVDGVDAVVYLIHGMGGDDFVEKDRESAQHMADAVTAAGVGRVVYLSGVVPDVPEDELSDHIASRLEVERVLGDSDATVITLRAAMIVGSGSTSLEIVRQISERVALQTVPTWMDSTVQPIAICDVLDCVAAALTVDVPSRSFDIGGPQAMPYAELLQVYADVAGLERPQVDVPLVPTAVVGKIAGRLTDVPSSTVESLIESLREDMIVHEDDFLTALLPQDHEMVDLRDSFERALADVDEAVPPAQRDPVGPMPQDPTWSGGGRSGAVRAVAGAVSGAAAKVVTTLRGDSEASPEAR